MSKKVFVCPECGYVFPKELMSMIESGAKVFCEKCGTSFSHTDLIYEQSKIQTKKYGEKEDLSFKEKPPTLYKAILGLNKFSFVPLLIISVIIIIFSFRNLLILFLGCVGLTISLYDKFFISPKLKKENYNLIVLDSFCLGILGCILFGTGVILLIKGVLIIIYDYNHPKYKNRNLYDFGLELKNSFNNFSALGGFLIIGLSLTWINRILEELNLIELLILLIISLIAILIDLILKKKIKNLQKVDILDFIGILTLGVLGSLFSGAGIFILLKGIICFFLLFGKPSEIKTSTLTHYKEEQERPIEKKIYEPSYESKQIKEEIPIGKKPIPLTYKTPELIKEDKVKEVKKEDLKIIEKEKAILEKEREIDLKLHESLLPVKDDKDKELVKEYFSKIFNVLSKELRNKINELKIPNVEKKELLNELVFLSKEEQIKYIEAIINLHQERIPKKLIDRIKQIPNIKPEYYAKIAEQLKFMDFDDQLKYIQYLEKKA